MNKIFKSTTWAFVFILSIFAISSAAQKMNPVWGDTTINPHDFTNRYYQNNGVNAKAILARRTGSDSYSVFGYTSNPNNSDVRVLITVPAYDQNGEIVYWYPLGELTDNGFADNTKAGVMARENAKLFPIYLFPEKGDPNAYTFANSRQAPLIDNFWSIYGKGMNPLGLRQILMVNYTEKAFTKEGAEMMAYFGTKNGFATDDTPLIKSVDDIRYLLKSELVTAEPRFYINGKSNYGGYAISPIITDPKNGVIAKDAYIWMSTKEGKPLEGEWLFTWHFGCLRDAGGWCE